MQRYNLSTDVAKKKNYTSINRRKANDNIP